MRSDSVTQIGKEIIENLQSDKNSLLSHYKSPDFVSAYQALDRRTVPPHLYNIFSLLAVAIKERSDVFNNALSYSLLYRLGFDDPYHGLYLM